MARAWRGHGASVAQTWRGPGADTAQAWRGHGAGVARTWHGRGANMARALRACPVPPRTHQGRKTLVARAVARRMSTRSPTGKVHSQLS
eukprot:gene8282-biopygen9152